MFGELAFMQYMHVHVCTVDARVQPVFRLSSLRLFANYTEVRFALSDD